ncbi:DNA-binding protein DDB_G0278111-like [Zingiber officinale]|uniref:Programmed cell death protein 5 n=1 Tax=Zingiber officinale TaxID=94328 RepID=A0A8J5LAX3_ZINOF|nr:DNA-binding protein DDB_G0278111-like [Zingiber officinale]KAG6511424.1 hypothetical protein ZIOFF_029492 [Zingiber officinale]
MRHSGAHVGPKSDHPSHGLSVRWAHEASITEPDMSHQGNYAACRINFLFFSVCRLLLKRDAAVATRVLPPKGRETAAEEIVRRFQPCGGMDDPELEAIRQRRMQELMGKHGAGNQQNGEQQKVQEEAKREAEERRQLMLSQILSTEARERLARIALVKPDKARGVEDVILRAAQMGQISEKVSEERLISLLEQINSQTSKQTKVTIQRRRSVLEDDD